MLWPYKNPSYSAAKPRISQWSTEIIIYMAGILDNCNYSIAKNTTSIMYRSTNKKFMEWLIHNFGGSYTLSTNKINKELRGYKRVLVSYRWRLCGQKILPLIYKAHHYQHEKREHSVLFIKFLSTFIGTGNKLNEAVVKERSLIIQQVRDLNEKRERINLKPGVAYIEPSLKPEEMSFLDLLFMDTLK